MVFYRERDHERPPLSRILPHLYLGAETDVTQDILSARGISYVLSVSRCSPQPSFLPSTQYHRVPIDDSLRDDLLPWIPGALRFIDEAVSAGGSVLVHCAAGISRSPALAVAYIMYSLGMDLDHAYRFVKERRPSISPNFNFLGQLQHFQSTLAQEALHGHALIQPLKSLDTCLQSANENSKCSPAAPVSANQNMNCQDNSCITKDFTAVAKVYSENSSSSPEQRPRPGDAGVALASGPPQQEERSTSPLTLALSSQLRTLTLTLNHNQSDVRSPCEASTPSPNGPEKSTSKSTQQQIPSGFASLSEKRKNLTLSLSPISAIPPTHHQGALKCNIDNSASKQLASICTSNTINHRKREASIAVKRCGRKASADSSSTQSDETLREASASHAKAARPYHSASHNKGRGEREGRAQGKGKTNRTQSGEKGKPNMAQKPRRDQNKGQAESWRSSIPSQRSTIVHQQVAPETRLPVSAVEAQEGVDVDQGVLSPLGLTVNKLLGWGERMLLGVLLGPRIKVGQAALPYRC